MNVGLEIPCWLWAGEQPHPSSGDNFEVSFGAHLAGGHSLRWEEWARGRSEEGHHYGDTLVSQGPCGLFCAGHPWSPSLHAYLLASAAHGLCSHGASGVPVLLGLAFWDKETTCWCDECVTRRMCRKGGSRELSREGSIQGRQDRRLGQGGGTTRNPGTCRRISGKT